MAQHSVGVRVDFASATLRNASFDANRHTGLRVGFLTDHTLREPVGIRVELVYATKGANAKPNWSPAVVVNYLELPVMARFALGREPGFFAMLGPLVAYRLSATWRGWGDKISPLEAGLVGGVGFDTQRFMGLGLTFDVRYTLGLTAPCDCSDPGHPDADDKNEVLSAGVGIRIF